MKGPYQEKEAPILYNVLDTVVRGVSYTTLWTSVARQRSHGEQVSFYLDDKINEFASLLGHSPERDYFVQKANDPSIRQYLSVSGQLTYITLDMAGLLDQYKSTNPAVAQCAFNYGLDAFCWKIMDDYIDKKSWPADKKIKELNNFEEATRGVFTHAYDTEGGTLRTLLAHAYHFISNSYPKNAPDNHRIINAKRNSVMVELKDAFARQISPNNDSERLSARLSVGEKCGEIEYYHLASNFKDFPKSYKKFQSLRGRAAAVFDDFKDYDIDRNACLGYKHYTRTTLAITFLKEFTKSYCALPFWTWDRNKYLAFNVLATLFHVREMIDLKPRS